MFEPWQLYVVRRGFRKIFDLTQEEGSDADVYSRIRPPAARIVLSEASRKTIESETHSSPWVETGGILVGHVGVDGTLQVAYASGPGPDAVRTPTYFLRDREYCEHFLREKYDICGADYIGDWHSHLGGEGPDTLSARDVQTLEQIINDPDYSDLPAFAAILAIRQRVFVQALGGSESWEDTIGKGNDAAQELIFKSRKKLSKIPTATGCNVQLKGYLASKEFLSHVRIQTVGDDGAFPNP